MFLPMTLSDMSYRRAQQHHETEAGNMMAKVKRPTWRGLMPHKASARARISSWLAASQRTRVMAAPDPLPVAKSMTAPESAPGLPDRPSRTTSEADCLTSQEATREPIMPRPPVTRVTPCSRQAATLWQLIQVAITEKRQLTTVPNTITSYELPPARVSPRRRDVFLT